MANENVVKSVGRVFEVLELFTSVQSPLNTQTICQRLNYPQSSTLVLLKSMAELGYLAFDSKAKTYFPTPRVSDLGNWIFPELQPGGELDLKLAALNEQTRETVYLTIQKNLNTQYIKIYPGKMAITLTIDEDDSFPLFSSAVGLALLSQKADQEFIRLIERCRDQPEFSTIDFAALKNTIVEIREAGFAALYDGLMPGAGAIGVPLPQSANRVNYAVGIAGPTERIRQNQAAIVETARQLFGS